jgi:hypothetical protein
MHSRLEGRSMTGGLFPSGVFPERRNQRWSTLSDGVSVVHDLVGHPDQLAKFLESHGLPIVFTDEGVPAIRRLLLGGRPTAVSGFVPPAVVDSVYGHAGWALSHVGEEVVELLPPVTNLDATSAVVRKRLRLLVFAPLPHTAPDVVGSRSTFPVPCSKPGGPNFTQKASTGLRSSVPEVGSIDVNHSPAVAGEAPYGAATATATGLVKRDQSPKTHASKINGFHLCNGSRFGCYGVWARAQGRRDKCMEVQ